LNSRNNYAAYCPDLPYVIATRQTRKEALELMKEAIEFSSGWAERRILKHIHEPTTAAASADVSV